jgi:hypothetical protein
VSHVVVQGRFRNELNRRNPMGCKGDLAEEYAALVVELHKQSYRHLAPRFFKDTLAQFAPQFSGYQQQDAQVDTDSTIRIPLSLPWRRSLLRFCLMACMKISIAFAQRYVLAAL